MVERQNTLTAEPDEKLTVASSTVEGAPEETIHLPGPSALPLLLGVGLLLIAVGGVTFWAVSIAGMIVTLFAIVSWARPAGAVAADPLEQTTEAAHGHEAAEGSALNWWGMVWFLLTEAVLFGFLIAAYLFIRNVTATEWPPAGVERLELVLPSIATGLLVASSFPMHWAASGIRKGNLNQLRYGLLATIIMGVVFLSMQAYEYVSIGLTPQQNVFGSIFFTLTGFHGFHVLIGLAMLSMTLWYAARGQFSARSHFGVTAAEMYWHFVDVVWILLFVSLYIV